jgi:hypothetical protein
MMVKIAALFWERDTCRCGTWTDTVLPRSQLEPVWEKSATQIGEKYPGDERLILAKVMVTCLSMPTHACVCAVDVSYLPCGHWLHALLLCCGRLVSIFFPLLLL